MPSVEHEEMVALMAGGLGLDQLSVAEQRAAMEASATMFEVPAEVSVETLSIAGIQADWLREGDASSTRTVLYLHGGGYVMGSRVSHRALAARLAVAAQAQVLVPDYRLAPEHPFPAALHDSLTCWRWLQDRGDGTGGLSLAGDSAGGGLALATVLSLRDAGAALPDCVVAMSPWTDLLATGDSATSGEVNDPLFTLEGIRAGGRLYAGDAVADPLASPLLADLRALPPLLLQVGTRELLLSDSTRFADRARTAGCSVTLEVEPELIHVWQMFAHLPEAIAAMQRQGAFIRRHSG